MKIEKRAKPKIQNRVQPSPGFVRWWMPSGHNPTTGAQTGGHPDALRKCVKPWSNEIAYFGLTPELAFACERYRQEYRQWLKDGMPEREVIDGTAAPLEKQRLCFRQIAAIMGGSPF
jgi:hypothetical protein